MGADEVSSSPSKLIIDTDKFGQTFWGIGGLSGGGGTSRLLYDYKEPQRSQILDYLFKPNYGASLQILKVEIGGDSQSTDGTESSHMHSADDLDYHRGYEWWLLQEAKKRNPEIKTYGLSWAFPGWVGGNGTWPFDHPDLLANYTLMWLKGARSEYNIDIDYIGIWNERSADGRYVTILRKVLDDNGFNKTMIVAKDGDKSICDEMAKDPAYKAAVGAVGLHYPSDYEDYSTCRNIGFGVNGIRGGKPTWSSEESSSHDDLNGGACWARIIMAHFVLQGFTSSIMWNLVGSYFHGTNWDASSMLTAQEPWTGNYGDMSPLWATAHTTQFTKIGWDMLEVGSGSGSLPKGGFYVTYFDPESKNWTLTISKISYEHASCTRPPLPPFATAPETVTFELAASLEKRSKLAMWYSNFENFQPDGSVPEIFVRKPDLEVKDGSITIEVPVGAVITISTILDGPQKGEPATPIPESNATFPLPLVDDFQSYDVPHEAKYWSDQIGSWEVHYEDESKGGSRKVMRQMTPRLPIGWTDEGTYGPMAVVGMSEWRDLTVKASFRLPKDSVDAGCIATRANLLWSVGTTLCAYGNGTWLLSEGGPPISGARPSTVYASGVAAALPAHSWVDIELTTVETTASASLGGSKLFEDAKVDGGGSGFALFGTSHWTATEFASIAVDQAGPHWTPSPAPEHCAKGVEGSQLHVRECVANGLVADDQVFELLPNYALRHQPSGLCASVKHLTPGIPVVLKKCDPTDDYQMFGYSYTRIRDELVPVWAKGSMGVLGLTGDKSGTLTLHLGELSEGQWNRWMYFPNTKQLRNVNLGGHLDLHAPSASSNMSHTQPLLKRNARATSTPFCLALCKADDSSDGAAHLTELFV